MQQKFQQDITFYTIHFTTLEPTRTITKWIAVPVALNKEEVKKVIFQKFNRVLEVKDIREVSEAILLH